MKLKTTIYGKSSTLIGTPDEISALLDAVRRTARQRAIDSLPRIVAAGERLASKSASKEYVHVKDAFKPTFEPIAQTREEIVNEAITDVADLLGRNFSSRECSVPLGVWFVSDYGRFKVTDELLFNVNKKKRTIHATIRNKTYPRNKYATGIARCAPSDVFNEHVGKAIALRRALGLEVPAKYYEVGGIVPEGKQVGDVVKNPFDEETTTLVGHTTADYGLAKYTSYFAEESKVIDDSARYVAPSTPAAKVVYVD